MSESGREGDRLGEAKERAYTECTLPVFALDARVEVSVVEPGGITRRALEGKLVFFFLFPNSTRV